MEEQESPRPDFIRSRVHWLIGAGALLLYLFTLNSWVTLHSLPVTAKVTGWDWSPALNSPIHYLVTLPCRWLPTAWQLPALNALSACFAALVLALLARSVAILPHDRTSEQRLRERDDQSLLSIPLAWIPPLLAVLTCGLQLSFWEHSTAATGEMLDLVLFAYAIRCLLEYRLDERESWLYRLALVYGAGLTNNWAMIGFLPLFLLALLWIQGRAFFNLRVLLRLAGLGLAGTLLYLLLPLLATLADPNLSFGNILLTELSNHKNMILGFPRSTVLVLSLTSILPVLIIGVRWPSSFGDTSFVGSLFTNLMFRLVHLMFLAACLWLAFDPEFSPRALGMGVPFLSFYYLAALSVGYFSGYFLLLAREPAGRTRLRHSTTQRLANQGLAGLVLCATLATPVGLVMKNFPVIQALNGPLLRHYAAQLAENLPAQNAIVLSDNPLQLHLVQAHRHANGEAMANAFVDTRMVNFALYQQYLNRLHPALWPGLPPNTKPLDNLQPAFLAQQIAILAGQQPVFYLHPSFGYFFELVYRRPAGLVYQLHPYGTNRLAAPPLTTQELDHTHAWMTQQTNSWLSLPDLSPREFPTARVLGEWYSRTLNAWAVELQRHDRLSEAGAWFQHALAANTNNLVASINARFGQSLRQNQPTPIPLDRTLERAFREFGGLEALLSLHGPFDEPNLCYEQGRVLVQNNLNRQAALAFHRTIALDPSNLRARIEFASACILGGAHQEALAAIDEARAAAGAKQLLPGDDIDLVRLASLAWSALGDTPKAEALLHAVHQEYPEQEGPLASLADLFISSNRYQDARQALEAQTALAPENLLTQFRLGTVYMRLELYDKALACFDEILRKQPGNLETIMNKAAIFIQTSQAKNAVPLLNTILRSRPDHRAALMNRAIAYLRSDQLDLALRDYQKLQKLLPHSHPIHYGLGTIAWKRGDHAEAIRHFERYLELLSQNFPNVPLSEEAKEVQSRLQELKPNQP